MAANDDTKAITASSMTGSDAHNAPKVLNTSHTIILCTRTQFNDDHLDKVLDAESRAGRFRTPDSKTARQNLCRNYLSDTPKHLPSYHNGLNSRSSSRLGICCSLLNWQAFKRRQLADLTKPFK
ncbi:hypothetical protein [Moraxella ovis]|uniref:hypothetical protein n=1 Tax=Moraxella ovis TaxID=29433 RepID=UPI000DD81626|nr:hypothetical protein [Moraxella ovis]